MKTSKKQENKKKSRVWGHLGESIGKRKAKEKENKKQTNQKHLLNSFFAYLSFSFLFASLLLFLYLFLCFVILPCFLLIDSTQLGQNNKRREEQKKRQATRELEPKKRMKWRKREIDSVNIWCIVFFPILKPLACGRQSRCLDWTYKLPGGQKLSIQLSALSVGFPQRRPLNLIKRPQFINSPGGDL